MVWHDALLDGYFSTLRQAVQRMHPQLDAERMEDEWRDLYGFAWADFYRFLNGWMPEHHKFHAYGEHWTQQALCSLKCV